MKINHAPEIDFLSIDFKEGIEARSYFENGMIAREDEKDNILGLDITDSCKLFFNESKVGLKEACKILKISESTLRRRIKKGRIKFTKKGNRYSFKKSALLALKE
jgi:excisionase family DNA binding protein